MYSQFHLNLKIGFIARPILSTQHIRTVWQRRFVIPYVAGAIDRAYNEPLNGTPEDIVICGDFGAFDRRGWSLSEMIHVVCTDTRIADQPERGFYGDMDAYGARHHCKCHTEKYRPVHNALLTDDTSNCPLGFYRRGIIPSIPYAIVVRDNIVMQH